MFADLPKIERWMSVSGNSRRKDIVGQSFPSCLGFCRWIDFFGISLVVLFSALLPLSLTPRWGSNVLSSARLAPGRIWYDDGAMMALKTEDIGFHGAILDYLTFKERNHERGLRHTVYWLQHSMPLFSLLAKDQSFTKVNTDENLSCK